MKKLLFVLCALSVLANVGYGQPSSSTRYIRPAYSDVPYEDIVDNRILGWTVTDNSLLVGTGSGIAALGVATDGQLPIGVTGSDPNLATLTGTANQLIVTNGAGSITLSLPQDVNTTSSPTFAGLTVTNAAVLGSDSAVFQPNSDSTTFFQVKDAAGNIVGNFDTTNKRFGIGTNAPQAIVHIMGSAVSGAGYGLNDSLIFERNGTVVQNLIANPSSSTQIVFSDDAYARGAIIYDHATNYLRFDTNASQRVRIDSSGNIGINEAAPETLTEWTSTVPYLTLHNSTHEDTDGGQESRLIFKGEDSSGTERETGRIEVSHDGTGIDGASKVVISTMTTGNVLTEAVWWDASQNMGTAGDIELGHASDTTLSRLGAGQLGIEGKYVVEDTSECTEIDGDGLGISSATLHAEICGDGTLSRFIRKVYVVFSDAVDVGKVDCEMGSRWNGDSDTQTNCEKSATTGNWTIDAAGSNITIEAAALSGNCVCVLSTELSKNESGTSFIVEGRAVSNDIRIQLLDFTAGTAEDVTSLVNNGEIIVQVTYLTDA